MQAQSMAKCEASSQASSSRLAASHTRRNLSIGSIPTVLMPDASWTFGTRQEQATPPRRVSARSTSPQSICDHCPRLYFVWSVRVISKPLRSVQQEMVVESEEAQSRGETLGKSDCARPSPSGEDHVTSPTLSYLRLVP